MKWWWGLVVGVLLASQTVYGTMAVTLYAGSATLPATTAATITTITGAARTFARVDYAAGATSCADWHFQLPLEYVAGNALEPVLDYYTAANDADVSVRYSIICAAQSEAYQSASFVNGSIEALTSGPSDGVVQRVFGGFTEINETGCDPLDHVVLRICRISDSNSGRFSIVKARVRF